jgi:hypothetical protein
MIFGILLVPQDRHDLVGIGDLKSPLGMSEFIYGCFVRIVAT